MIEMKRKKDLPSANENNPKHRLSTTQNNTDRTKILKLPNIQLHLDRSDITADNTPQTVKFSLIAFLPSWPTNDFISKRRMEMGI